MSKCPVCTSTRIVIIVDATRRAFCTRCGTRWIQDGVIQRSVRRVRPAGAPGSV
jgi:Zn-finger nucleic acid-binding protein